MSERLTRHFADLKAGINYKKKEKDRKDQECSLTLTAGNGVLRWLLREIKYFKSIPAAKFTCTVFVHPALVLNGAGRKIGVKNLVVYRSFVHADPAHLCHLGGGTYSFP